eukprot:scaffold6771_cov138-Isochrysis_galbana.AAC.1
MRPAGGGGRRPGCRVRTPMCDRVWLYGHVAMISMHMRYVAHSAMARFSHRLLRASRQPSTFYVTYIETSGGVGVPHTPYHEPQPALNFYPPSMAYALFHPPSHPHPSPWIQPPPYAPAAQHPAPAVLPRKRLCRVCSIHASHLTPLR